ncbi:MAG: Cytochrome c biogenesis protein CcmG [Candidatus Accumulibacter appositus]|uniref:Cytochrome c biogenesis protein CcmG n=1 Tax=Candidatus Accumulibacter appositus TaxID=1454003 RepID=A0A011PZP6_9PROT|nr:TlpA disulfide reductase family protein [Accumulibacter sp.]EXI82380.1 MAG: Cytochrome c biogenesis protein CcmG [Candidatus Accumulibacter appositus]HRF03482.1 TlpA disulfide reductase family protein [Accumulibacter sp.]
MKRLAALLLLVLFAISGRAAELPSAAPFFALTLPAIDGPAVALGSLKGKPLLVNFWARWCAPCRQEIPDLAALQARYRGRGLLVVGIAVEDADKLEQLREFGRAYEMNYTSLIGGSEASIELMKALGNSKAGLPFSVLIDRDGRIRSSELGAMDQAEMEEAVRPIL